MDLPSFGRDEVMPITLLVLTPLLKSAATFMARIDSAKRDSGELATIHNDYCRPR